MNFPLIKVLKNGMLVELDYMHPQEHEVVRALLNVVIFEGKTYPQKQPLSYRIFSLLVKQGCLCCQDICYRSYTQAKRNIRGVLFKAKLSRSV